MHASTFPGGSISMSPPLVLPGLSPGQLFASSVGSSYSSIPRGGGGSAPASSGKAHIGAAAASNESRSRDGTAPPPPLHPTHAAWQQQMLAMHQQVLSGQQQMQAMLQTLYHQQLALQSQVNQVVLSLQPLQMGGPSSSHFMMSTSQNEFASYPSEAMPPPSSASNSRMHLHATDTNGTQNGFDDGSMPLGQPSAHVAAHQQRHHHDERAMQHSTNGTDFAQPVEESASFSCTPPETQPADDAAGRRTPVQQVELQPANVQRVDPPRRSPSKPATGTQALKERYAHEDPVVLRLTPNDNTHRSPEPHRSTTSAMTENIGQQSLAATAPSSSSAAFPLPSQGSDGGVALSWHPKRYSRSSSVNSSVSHPNTTTSASGTHEQRPATPRSSSSTGLGIATAAQPFATNPLLATQRLSSNHLHIPSAANATDTSTPSNTYDAYLPRRPFVTSQNVSVSSIEDPYTAPSSRPVELQGRAGESRLPASMHTLYAANRPLAVPQRATSTAMHDVSLSDDGYISMDSAEYMRRFHLR